MTIILVKFEWQWLADMAITVDPNNKIFDPYRVKTKSKFLLND